MSNDSYGNALQLIATWVGLGDRDECELYDGMDFSDEGESKRGITSDLFKPFRNSSDEIKRQKLDGIRYLSTLGESDLQGFFDGALVTLEIGNYSQFVKWISDIFDEKCL